jgi:hypothetical protein
MADSQRRVGGTISFRTNGEVQFAKGEFTCVDSAPKRTAVTGTDTRVHGFKEEARVPSIKGTITMQPGQDVRAFFNLVDATITAELANGQMFTLGGAWYAGEAQVTSGEGEIDVMFEGMTGEWVR